MQTQQSPGQGKWEEGAREKAEVVVGSENVEAIATHS